MHVSQTHRDPSSTDTQFVVHPEHAPAAWQLHEHPVEPPASHVVHVLSHPSQSFHTQSLGSAPAAQYPFLDVWVPHPPVQLHWQTALVPDPTVSHEPQLPPHAALVPIWHVAAPYASALRSSSGHSSPGHRSPGPLSHDDGSTGRDRTAAPLPAGVGLFFNAFIMSVRLDILGTLIVPSDVEPHWLTAT